ncbi:MAG: transcriptional regulator [Bernardetiaceae bacterium]|nr:transcriptional regulator [Bernardetiaceae bacterium]
MRNLTHSKDIEQIEYLENEYELKKASLWEHKLRVLSTKNPYFVPLRKKIRGLIRTTYEDKYWSDFEQISEARIIALEKAETLVEAEQQFVQQRKTHILTKLKGFDMTKQNSATLLGYAETYTLELLHGLSSFAIENLIVLHNIFDIDLAHLIPTYLPLNIQDHTTGHSPYRNDISQRNVISKPIFA